MSRRNERADQILERCAGKERDAHYLAYFECFNEGLYFEAHEVLEHLWLPQRTAPNGPFYKGLIQLAGAFVHFQKGRVGPSMALLNLARSHLQCYDRIHEGLDLQSVRSLIEEYLAALDRGAFVSSPPSDRF